MDEFNEYVQKIQNKEGFKKPLAFGICKLDFGENGDVLQATYPSISWTNENICSYALFWDISRNAKKILDCDEESIIEVDEAFVHKALQKFIPFIEEAKQNPTKHKNVALILEIQKVINQNLHMHKNFSKFRFVSIFKDVKCKSVESSYMKLLGLSLGKAPIRSLNLEGVFGLLKNVAWSGNVPYELSYLRKNEIALKVSNKYPHIDYVDKFPRYLMQVIPQYDNIRILDAANTRFGAYLGKGGYTQMPGASYINFNAGVHSACMNEGRISSSVIIGEGTDLGGGASVLGILSGGNESPISIGKNCLLGANSVTGISLGDGCIVDAGIAVLSGTVFFIDDKNYDAIREVNENFNKNDKNLYKGLHLSSLNGIHFRCNSKNGVMSALRSKKKIALNKDLH